MKRLSFSLLFLILIFTDLPVQASDEKTERKANAKNKIADRGTILKRLVAEGNYRTLVTALVAADLTTVLDGDGPLVLLAPTDDAFARLPAEVLKKLLQPENKQDLAKILKFHVIPGKASFLFDSGAYGTFRYKTAEGSDVTLKYDSHTKRFNQSQIIKQFKCDNGAFVGIDKVLIPEESPASQPGDPLEAAKKLGNCNTFIAAVNAAGLKDVLTDKSAKLTVLIPTDAAFAKLPKGTVDKLLLPENRNQLVTVLKNHVIAGKLGARDLAASRGLNSLVQSLETSIRDGRLTVNASGVIQTDIVTSNGIVHVIDAVLVPGL